MTKIVTVTAWGTARTFDLSSSTALTTVKETIKAWSSGLVDLLTYAFGVLLSFVDLAFSELLRGILGNCRGAAKEIVVMKGGG